MGLILPQRAPCGRLIQVPATPSSAGPRLDVDLVPVLEHKARPQFLRDDFETAAFVAMKEGRGQFSADVDMPMVSRSVKPAGDAQS
jgi:hypothetical protein